MVSECGSMNGLVHVWLSCLMDA